MRRFKPPYVTSGALAAALLGALIQPAFAQQPGTWSTAEAMERGELRVRATGVGRKNLESFLCDVFGLRCQETPPAQKKAQAFMDAVSNAHVALAKILDGVAAEGRTLSEAAGFESGFTETRVEGFVRGARRIASEDSYDGETAYVSLRLPVLGLGGMAQRVRSSISIEERYEPPPAPSRGAPNLDRSLPLNPSPPDGLIVDVREHLFEKHFFNSVVYGQEGSWHELHGVGRVEAGTYARHLTGGYTTEEGRARAALSARGSERPMTVQAIGVALDYRAAQVSLQDAAAIFAANQQTGFLEAAKVMFVVSP